MYLKVHRHQEEPFQWFQEAVQTFTSFRTTECTFLFHLKNNGISVMVTEMLDPSFQGKEEFRTKHGTLYHTGLSLRRVTPLACGYRSWKQFKFGTLFLFLIKTEVICKNSAGILKLPSRIQKDFFSSLKTSKRLCLLPPLTHIYQAIKAASGLYKKVCPLGGGTKNITFLSECNKTSLNKVSKGRSHYSLPELEAPSCNSSYTAHLFQAQKLG